jgi:WS/DGAT/MGAT family acyltransferase
MAQRLDVDRPLWEMWLVEGLTEGRWAVVTKTHHAMIDGLAGNELMETVLDREPGRTRPSAQPWRPRSTPSRLGLAAAGAGWLVRLPVEVGRSVGSAAGALRSPSDVLRSGVIRVYGLAEFGRSAASPTSVLNGPLGPHRRWGWARADLADVKAVKDAAGCTVNDVVLAAIAGGFRHYLLERGEPVDDVLVRSLVPVSIRTEEHRGRLGNQVTAVFADLPVGVDTAAGRLAAVAAQMNHLKGSGVAVTVDSLMSAGDFVPATLMTLGARVYAKVGQRVVNTVTTNIPGPQYPLYLLDRRMLEMFPYIPVAQGVRISVGIVSYDGQLAIGATGDYDAVPDLDVLCSAIEDGLRELVASARPPTGMR